LTHCLLSKIEIEPSVEASACDDIQLARASRVEFRSRYLVGIPDRTAAADIMSFAASLSSTVALRATPLAKSKPRVAAKPRAVSVRAMAPTQDELKKLVGYKSVDDHVESGMVVGLGTGSTAYFAVERLGQKIASGELTDIVAIPTSVRTKEQAESLKIPLCTLNEKSILDVAIDGADEVDPDLALVKGGGGALLREKMVEVMAKKFVVIVDESKLCKGLGPGFPLPVEITPFCHMHTLRTIADLPSVKGCEAVLRMGSSSTNKPDGDEIAVTDNGNYIVDLHFKEPIKDVNAAASELKNTVGVVDHGLFVGMSYQVIVAGSDGIKVAGTGGEKAWW
jgi:ribose 5-phosphate isomerase A